MKLESLNERAASNLSARVWPLPLLCGGARDRLSRFLGLARSLRGKPSRARRSVCDLYRLLAQARPRGEGPKKHRSLRGCNDGVDPKLLLPVRHAAALRAQALAAHGQYPAGALSRKRSAASEGFRVGCGHASDLLSPASFSAGRHPARRVAVPSLHPKLSRCRGAACRAWTRHLL